LRNGLVQDPERLPDIMKKHFTEQMAEFEACPWSEGQGGDLDGERRENQSKGKEGKLLDILF
jgi:hypothetical protein